MDQLLPMNSRTTMGISLVLALLISTLPNTAIASEVLPLSIQSALKYRNVPAQALSVYVEEVATGEVILAWNEAVARNPASVEKMVTTLVALDTLGPAYRWKTEVSFLGDIKDGVLDGDIALKGYGDPYLVTERFWQLLRKIRAAGINSISGDLLIDDSHFAVGDYDPAAFDREPLRAYNVSPNALLTNFKVVRHFFEPAGDASGVHVRMDPHLQNLDIVNQLRVANGSCRGYQRGITITPNEGVSRITFSGRFPSGCEIYSMTRAALSHNEFTYGLFRSLWEESGGALSGEWRNVVLEPNLEPALIFESLPLAEIITKVNKHSNNVMAKQLLFTLAAEEIGAAGTAAKGRQVIDKWLAERGLTSAEMRLANGAGLSRSSRVTAKHLSELLRYAYDSPFMPEYVSSLSLSGMDGTLRRRLHNNGLSGQAHMKTGSLDHVSAIGGYLQSRSGKRFIVVAMLNHTDVHRGPGEEVQESLLRWLYEQ